MQEEARFSPTIRGKRLGRIFDEPKFSELLSQVMKEASSRDNRRKMTSGCFFNSLVAFLTVHGQSLAKSQNSVQE